MRLPGLNEYTKACRANAYQGARMKKDAEDAILPFIRRLPVLKPPVVISFHWAIYEDKRDLDNIAFAKKFILDALVKARKLQDDDRRHVIGFSDTFFRSAAYKAGVIIEIKEGKKNDRA